MAEKLQFKQGKISMKNFILTLSLIVLAFVPFAANADKHDQTNLYAVAFHADWCGSCKILGPNITKARGKADLDNQNVLFVTLDLTNATTRNQSKLMAHALGLGEFYKTNAGKTGFVLLVNSKTGEILGKLTKDMDSGKITQMITDKVSSL